MVSSEYLNLQRQNKGDKNAYCHLQAQNANPLGMGGKVKASAPVFLGFTGIIWLHQQPYVTYPHTTPLPVHSTASSTPVSLPPPPSPHTGKIGDIRRTGPLLPFLLIFLAKHRDKRQREDQLNEVCYIMSCIGHYCLLYKLPQPATQLSTQLSNYDAIIINLRLYLPMKILTYFPVNLSIYESIYL